MAARITLTQIITEPTNLTASYNEARGRAHADRVAAGELSQEPQDLRFDHILPGVDPKCVFPLALTYIGGGNQEQGRFLLDVAYVEPADEPQD